MKNHSKKPTNTPAPKAPQPPVRREPTEDQIRARAHQIFLQRGGSQGHELEDWVAAERELRKR